MEFSRKRKKSGVNTRKKQSSTTSATSTSVSRRLDFSPNGDVSSFSTFTANLQSESASQSLRDHPHMSTSFPRARTTQRPASFYGSSRITTASRDAAWGPRETLPRTSSPVAISGRSPDLTFHRYHPRIEGASPRSSESSGIIELLQNFQTSVDKKLATVEKSLESIVSRLDQLETRQTTLETTIQSLPQSSITTPTPTSAGVKRKRLTPSSLQCKIRRVHSAFDEDNQLRVSEPINSTHNSTVVNSIVETIGVEVFSEDQVRKGCTTYRKTLFQKTKKTSTPTKKLKQIRSRQQRSYERRTKQVKPNEKNLWDNVTANMMSDEEKDPDGDQFVRHQPSYRSDKLNSFIAKLDSRFERKHHQQPRTKRIIGSPVSKPVPTNAKSWMINSTLTQNDADNEASQSGNDEASQSGNEQSNSDAGSDNEKSSDSDEESDVY